MDDGAAGVLPAPVLRLIGEVAATTDGKGPDRLVGPLIVLVRLRRSGQVGDLAGLLPLPEPLALPLRALLRGEHGETVHHLVGWCSGCCS